ncbi:DNA-binding transcriptional LysR family regulator [Streptomyces sp. SAI-124]
MAGPTWRWSCRRGDGWGRASGWSTCSTTPTPPSCRWGTRSRTGRVVDLHELSGEQWVGSEPPGPCLEPVIDSCAAAGFSPDFVIRSEDYATAQGFVAAGLGVGLMPRLGLRGRHPGVVVRPVRNPEPVRVISAVARETALDQPALRGLLTALREAAATDEPAAD